MKRLLLGCGNRVWLDLERARQEMAAYHDYEVMHGAARGADTCIDAAAIECDLEPGVNLHRRPADWNRYGNAAGRIRNEAMADEVRGMLDAGWHVEGLALGALVRADNPGRKSGTGHMVGLLRQLGVRVRWVPAPDAEAQILALRVHSARCGQGRDPDDLDITRAHGGPQSEPLAPSWDILNPVLDARRRAGALRPTEPEAAEAIEAQAWTAYVPRFMAEMRRSYRHNREAWLALLACERVVLRCRCQDPTRCHRALLRERILPALGAVDMGELPPPDQRQLRIPGT